TKKLAPRHSALKTLCTTLRAKEFIQRRPAAMSHTPVLNPNVIPARTTLSRLSDACQKIAQSEISSLLLLAALSILLHTLTNGRYGFHRDELASLDDGRNLQWGYVAYPPLTPLLARFAFTLFGPSLI